MRVNLPAGLDLSQPPTTGLGFVCWALDGSASTEGSRSAERTAERAAAPPPRRAHDDAPPTGTAPRTGARLREAARAATRVADAELRREQAARRSTQSASDACCICLDAIGVARRAEALPCMHAFHDACISTWLRLRSACPLCNAAVSGLRRQAA